MSWIRYLLHDFWTAREFNRMEEEVAGNRAMTRWRTRELKGDLAGLRERVLELEDDLGRATLLLRALADTCVKKGLLSRAELQVVASRLDAEDGSVDGKTKLSRRDDHDDD